MSQNGGVGLLDSLKGMLMVVKLRLKLADGTSNLEVSLKWPVMLLVLLICQPWLQEYHAYSCEGFQYVYKDKDFYCSWDVYRPEYDLVRNSPTYGKYNSKIWKEMIALLRSFGTNVEIVEKPRGLCIRTTFTRPCISLPSKGLDLVACVLGKRESDWYIIDTPVHSSSLMIGLVLSNSSKTAMCSIPDTVLETAICLSVQESLCSVTLSLSTKDISVRIEYYLLG